MLCIFIDLRILVGVVYIYRLTDSGRCCVYTLTDSGRCCVYRLTDGF